MTASREPNSHPLPTNSSPLLVGPADYFAAVHSTLQLTAAWATAVSAFSRTILSQAGDRATPVDLNTEFRGLYAVRAVDPEGTSTTDHAWLQHSWANRNLEPHVAGGMLRWLTEPPTLQPDLFDEVVELLVDEDIKTAS